MLTSSQDLNKLRIIPYQLQGTLIATEMGKKKNHCCVTPDFLPSFISMNSA